MYPQISPFCALSILISLAAHPALAHPIHGPASKPFAPYATAPMLFTGHIDDSGRNVTLAGSAQAIHAQILELHPLYNITATALARHSATAAVEKREMISRDCTLHNPEHVGAMARANWGEVFPIEDGIRYIKGLNGTCTAPAYSCVTLSCSWAAKIALCNDNNHDISPDCFYLGATMAQTINDHCVKFGVVSNAVGGRVWDSGNYSVTILGEDC